MTLPKTGRSSCRMILVLAISATTAFSNAQTTDSTKVASTFGGNITLTTKGISTIPNFTLGKPAAIFELSMGRRKVFFEPQFRFGLNGKPWSFIFWWRYRLIRSEKMHLTVGAHPAITFKTMPLVNNGTTRDYLVADRYLAAEMIPSWLISRNVSVGVHYLYSLGLEKDITRNTHFISLRSSFSNIGITDQYFLRFNPQIYYLIMDERDGFYVNSTIALVKRDFPIYLSSQINTPLTTDIPSDTKVLWNISMIYNFGREYVRK